jgi:hypothetical protein
MRRAGPSEDDGESKNRDDQTRADYKDALQHLTTIRRNSGFVYFGLIEEGLWIKRKHEFFVARI